MEAQYRASNGAERIQRSRIGCIVALAAFPMGSTLDLIIYPDKLFELSVIRYLSLALVACIFFMHRLEWFKRHIRVTNFFMPVVVALSMCAMISVTDGFQGPFYAALNLLILGVSLLLPFSLRDALALVWVTLVGFSVAGWLHGAQDQDYRQVFNNYYFLIATGLIACTASFFAERARRREFALNYELAGRNQELDQRNHELAELDRMKSNFFANVSHELRTPLTLILSPVEELLRSAMLPERVRTQMIFVRDNSYRLLNLVNDLLDLMKLEEGMTRIETGLVRLNSLVSNVVGAMQHYAKQKNVTLTVSAPDSVAVIGDHRAIEKIVINIVNNALKFTPSGGSVSVAISVVNGRGEFSVRDTGPGIERDHFDMIFDRFQQVDTSSTRKHQGTGLGLALVKELVELQGGKVVVESDVGEGATFRVSLPLADGREVSASALQEAQQPGVADVHARARLSLATPEASVAVRNYAFEADQRPRLVIVEDEADIRSYLQEALEGDFQVRTAADGTTGWDLIESTTPDLVISDLMLPGMDGLTLCKKITQSKALRNVKVMLLTARTDEKSKMTALDHGAHDFVVKPFSTLEIKKRLANLWLTSHLQRTLHEQNIELEAAMDSLKQTQGKLVQSEKLNALGRLSAGLLHEVNNPLNYAYGTFQLLEREPLLKENDRIREMMADIRDGMERISAIVRDLKTFAYPEAVDLRSEFDLSTAVASARRLSAQSLRGIQVEVAIPEPAVCVGSQSHIVQVLINLFENACHAMEKSGREQHISIRSHVDPNGRMQIRVRDSGTGIPADILSRVFDPFFTTKDVGSGLGMGLSICHTIVDNHGGVLTVDSDSTSYTEFCFDLATPSSAVTLNPEEDGK